jgi:hypothetical protein
VPKETGLAKKLNLKEGMKVQVDGKPAEVNLGDVAITKSSDADGIILFVKKLADLENKSKPVVEAAKEDRIAWVVYPKSGQLGTDLNRDILWKHLLKQRIQGVRQISIDNVWSAMRFRPAK